MSNFVPIGQIVAEAVFDFTRWRPSAILDLFYACLGYPRSILGDLYIVVQKLVGIGRAVFKI